MLPVETLTFTKEQRTLPCKIVRMQQDDLDTILNYQQKLCDALQDADIFVPLSRQEWQYLLDHGFALAVLPENPPAHTDSIAYLIGCLYPADTEKPGTRCRFKRRAAAAHCQSGDCDGFSRLARLAYAQPDVSAVCPAAFAGRAHPLCAGNCQSQKPAQCAGA